MPDYGARYSEYASKQDGPSFVFSADEGYRNDLSPEADENQGVIKMLMEAIPADTEKKLMEFCSPYIVESLQFLRSLFLVRIGGETENVEKSDKVELRQQMSKTAEESIRAVLKRIQVAEEVSSLRSGLISLQL